MKSACRALRSLNTSVSGSCTRQTVHMEEDFTVRGSDIQVDWVMLVDVKQALKNSVQLGFYLHNRTQRKMKRWKEARRSFLSFLSSLWSLSCSVHTRPHQAEGQWSTSLCPSRRVWVWVCVCVCVCLHCLTVSLCLFQTYIFTDGEDKELRMRTGKKLDTSH